MSLIDEQIPDSQWLPDGWLLPASERPLPKGTMDAAMRAAFPVEHALQKDPKKWIQDRLGEWVWSKQVEVAESVRDNRYTAVPSAHQTGKSWLAARVACWWLDTHPPGEAFVVTSAPTQTQVEAILWREIEKAHRKAGLSGYITKGQVPMWKTEAGEIVAYGRKPADKVNPEEAMQSFQGIHAKYVLVILDEAGGIPQWLYDATDSLVGNDLSRVLAIGNPDNPSSQFEKVCRPGSGWNVIRISALDTPNFTGEWVPDALRHLLVGKQWVRERIKRWGKRSPRFISKVLGRFPKVADDTLLSPDLLERCMNNDMPGLVHGRFGADIADQGTDETVVYHNRGGHIRLAEMPDGSEARWHGQDTMKTSGQLVRLRREWPECSIVVDSIGIGAGVRSRLVELDHPVMGFNAAERAYRPDKFRNRRSEQWWAFRELCEAGLVDLDPEDEDLLAQLGSIKWTTDSSGRTVIEKKDDTKKRLGGNSPDRADACMMSTVNFDHLPPVEERAGDRRLEEALKDAELSAGIMEKVF